MSKTYSRKENRVDEGCSQDSRDELESPLPVVRHETYQREMGGRPPVSFAESFQSSRGGVRQLQQKTAREASEEHPFRQAFLIPIGRSGQSRRRN